MAGKNMNYFLMDSTPNGRIKCTLANWTGVAYMIPRIKLVDCINIDYLNRVFKMVEPICRIISYLNIGEKGS